MAKSLELDVGMLVGFLKFSKINRKRFCLINKLIIIRHGMGDINYSE